MTIVEDSRRVLNALYNLITENSNSLSVEFGIPDVCETVNMTKEHLSLCIHYLVLGEYIIIDTEFKQTDERRKIILTVLGINKIEKAIL